MISNKQKQFCKEYIIDHNATKACIRAGYSVNTANRQGSRLLTKDHIIAEIKRLEDNKAVIIGHDRDKAIAILHEALALGRKQANTTAIISACRELDAISGLHSQTIINDTVDKVELTPEEESTYAELARLHGLKLARETG